MRFICPNLLDRKSKIRVNGVSFSVGSNCLILKKHVYWETAKADNYFVGVNEYLAYDPESLQTLIATYGDQ